MRDKGTRRYGDKETRQGDKNMRKGDTERQGDKGIERH